MTTANLLADLRRDEGCRLTAYPDPKSGAEPWTIGYGHTGREVHPDLVWTMAQALAALSADVRAACNGLSTALPWWTTLDDVRQDCLANMAFNMGVHGLLEFRTFLAFMQAGKFGPAALDLTPTPWAHETGDRAKRIILQIRTGVHQP